MTGTPPANALTLLEHIMTVTTLAAPPQSGALTTMVAASIPPLPATEYSACIFAGHADHDS
jgi:hypothetical protein